MSEGPPLDLWAALKTAALLASALGTTLTLPTPQTPQAPAATPNEVAAARALLARYSAIADLPEE